MMVAFDTLRAARRLREEGGFDERQAGILVDTFAEGMSATLATKADLEKTEAALRGDLETLRGGLEKTEVALRGDLEKTEAALRGELGTLRSDLQKTETKLQGQIRELEQRMTIRLGAMMVGSVALIVALNKLL